MNGASAVYWLTNFVSRTLTRLVGGRYWVLGCLLGAGVLRGIWVATMAPSPISDFYSYYNLALRLAQHFRYESCPGFPTAYFPPGYPAMLALCFKIASPSLVTALCCNVLLQVAGVWLIYAVARELFASEAVGRIAMLAWALHPNSIIYTALIASEHLFIPLMLLGMLLLLQARRLSWLAIPAGIVFGIAVLTRPQAILLPALCYLILLPGARQAGLLRRWVWQCALTHLLLLAVVLPWVARNARLLHKPLLTTTTGWNLYIGNNPDANGGYVFTERMQAALPAVASELERDELCRALARQYIRAHPAQIVALLPRKLVALYVSELDGVLWIRDSLRHPFYPFTDPPLPLTLGQKVALIGGAVLVEAYYLSILVALVLALSVVVCRKRGGEWPSALSLLAPAIICYFTALYLVYYGMPRYHMPMLPWMIITIAGLAVCGKIDETAGVDYVSVSVSQ